VQGGTKIEFPNNDRVFHNVFSFRDGKRFDLGLYPVGAVKTIPFDRPGLSRVFCNIHPGMAAYIMVVDTPVFAVSDRRYEGANLRAVLHDEPFGPTSRFSPTSLLRCVRNVLDNDVSVGRGL